MATIDKYKLKIEVDGKEEVIDLQESLNNLSTGFARIGTAGLTAFTALAASGVKLADQMDDIGKAFGMTAGEVYNLSRAIEASGGNFNDTQQLLSGFSRSLGEVERGSSNTIKALGKLGLSRKELETLSDKELFAAAVQGLADMDDGFAKTQLAMEIFGKAAAGIDFDELAKGTKEAVDPELEKRLKAAGDAYDKLAAAFRDLQMVALKAIGPIIDAINELNFDSEDAKKAIQILGAVIAAAFAAAVVTRVFAIVDAIKKLAAATRAAATAQAFMVGLTGVGLAAVVASAAAATAAYVALGKAMEEAGGGGVDRPDTGGSPTTAPGGTPTRTVGQTPEERAVAAAKQQTQELRRQLQAQNEYRQALINTIGLREQDAAKRKSDLDIEKQAKDDIAKIDEKIKEERAKGVDANKTVIRYYEEQKKLLADQVPITKALADQERTRIQAEKDKTKEFDLQRQLMIETLKMRTEETASITRQLLALGNIGPKAEDSAQKSQLLLSNSVTLLRMAAEAATSVNDIPFENTKKIFDDINSYIVKLIDNQGKFNNMAERQAYLTEQMSPILAQFPEEKRKEVEALLRLIDLEIERNRIRMKGVDEISTAEQELAKDMFKGSMKALVDLAESVSPFKLAMDSVNSVINNVDNALSEFIKNGKFNFKDFAQSILADLAVLIARFLVFQTILAIVGGINPAAGAALSRIIGGARAAGGPVKAGKAYLVGERGPELFMPNSSGSIVPNNQLAMAGGGGTNVTYNINAVDASSFRSLVARDPQFIFNVTEVGRRSSPARRLA